MADDKALLDARFTQPDGWQWQVLEPRTGEQVRIGWVCPKTPKGLVFIGPGLSEYSEKYFEIGHDLMQRGFAVACIDWRGQGLSHRHAGKADRRIADSFSIDSEDALFALYWLDKHTPLAGLPRMYLGHSMGSHIGLRMLHDGPDLFKCAVFSTPLIAINMPSPAADKAARFVLKTGMALGLKHRYLPKQNAWQEQGFVAKLSHLTSDPARRDMQAYWLGTRPELRMGGLTYSWLNAAYESMDHITRPGYFAGIATPFLFVVAGNDKIVSTPAAQAIYKQAPHGECLLIDDALHEVMMERDRLRDKFWYGFDGFTARHFGPKPAL